AIWCQLFGVIESNDAALGVEYDGGGDDGTEESAATGLIKSGDAGPTQLACSALVARRAKTPHVLSLPRNAAASLARVHDGSLEKRMKFANASGFCRLVPEFSRPKLAPGKTRETSKSAP